MKAAPCDDRPVGLATSFVGRTDVKRQLGTLIDEGRLVTLTASGGIGKTRLAAKVAAEAIDRAIDAARGDPHHRGWLGRAR